MKIIIPMSGIGSRFIEAGYSRPKPLIRVGGRPIIDYVIQMFPGDHDFIFICNQDHLDRTDMRQVLLTLKPDSKIISIGAYKKRGPVYALSHAFPEIEDNEEVMTSYCDYFMDWDFGQFQREMQTKKWQGAVPSYTGFHPHLLQKKKYAGVLAGNDGRMIDIKEKHCFTEDPQDSHHSAGAYHFTRGADLKKYCQELMDKDINLNGEYYTSMVYYLSLRDKQNIYVPPIRRFMQWGTPEDLEEFEAWARYFAAKFGQEKRITDIPTDREPLIKIPHAEGSPEFEQSRVYWEEYFANNP